MVLSKQKFGLQQIAKAIIARCIARRLARKQNRAGFGRRVTTDESDSREFRVHGAKTIAVGCPFCSVMLNDAVTARQAEGIAQGVEVLDVATLLLEASKK